ncbi:MAG TPA: SRPBCC family protein [Candidatus Baltobacteraceae bacterium]|jgi:uncharacterized protein YndB with AHSA1/START domain|nr:SRPBCC family protein [Candidatus Baltobacteraceae bacterium]
MSDLATIDARGTLTLVRHLPGPIERVWAYLTDPQYLSKWFSEGVVANAVGGEVRFEMGAYGQITAYNPPHILEYTWSEDDAAVGPIADSVLRWELAREGNGVRLMLTHMRLPDVEVVAHCAGWHAFLDRLLAFDAGRTVEPVMDLYAKYKPVYGG